MKKQYLNISALLILLNVSGISLAMGGRAVEAARPVARAAYEGMQNAYQGLRASYAKMMEPVAAAAGPLSASEQSMLNDVNQTVASTRTSKYRFGGERFDNYEKERQNIDQKIASYQKNPIQRNLFDVANYRSRPIMHSEALDLLTQKRNNQQINFLADSDSLTAEDVQLSPDSLDRINMLQRNRITPDVFEYMQNNPLKTSDEAYLFKYVASDKGQNRPLDPATARIVIDWTNRQSKPSTPASEFTNAAEQELD